METGGPLMAINTTPPFVIPNAKQQHCLTKLLIGTQTDKALACNFIKILLHCELLQSSKVDTYLYAFIKATYFTLTKFSSTAYMSF